MFTVELLGLMKITSLLIAVSARGAGAAKGESL